MVICDRTSIIGATLAVAAVMAWWPPGNAGAAPKLMETPSLAAQVAKGELPPVAERVPSHPRVIDLEKMGRVSGRHGGDWRWLIRRERDVRQMVVYGYSRLVGYDENYDLVPDILESIDVRNGRVFTMKLRPGHRWSDGSPFTTEDFRYYWEDVANNPKLSPAGPPRILFVGDEEARVDIIDATTVRYSWSKPNPFFLPALAGARPLYIFMPARYLKQFHQKYADAETLKAMLKKARRRNWASLHRAKDSMYKMNNPALPTLQPWRIKTKAPSTRYVAVRNPYFHRVDSHGRQLPYFDRVIMTVTDTKLIPIKTASGDTDLQARGLAFNNVTFLKANEKRAGYDLRLWRTAKGAHIALFPNLSSTDPVWRALFRDVRFRRALSLAVDRPAVNQALYFGLAIEGNNTVLAASPLFKPEYQKAWAQYDLNKANALLDAVGLSERDEAGFRMLASGKRLEIIVETAGEDTEQTDVLELVRESWARAGIKLFIKPSQREVFRNRIFSGRTLMSVWTGIENGVPTADMSPRELAPTSQQQLQWPKWGQYVQTGGKAGEAIDMPVAQELARLNQSWLQAPGRAERERIWHRMLKINAEQVYSIGIISGVLQPVVVSKRMRNVPEKGVYNWDPGAHLGIYMPDTFWYE